MTRAECLWLGIVVPILVGWMTACTAIPVVEKPPCDEATPAQIVATCSDEADCNVKLDARQSLCAKRIKGE